MSRQTVARINLSAIRNNLATVRKLAPASQVACVVKADAYGHGLRNVFPALDAAGILAVATIDEAQQCRELGWTKRLVMLEGPSNTSEREIAQRLACDLVIHHDSQLPLLRNGSVAESCGLWLKLDSGMHRLGFPLLRTQEIFTELTRISGAKPSVLMSHFACADNPANPKTEQQMSAFDDAVTGLPGQISLANSGGVLNFPDSHRDIVRPGIMVYGVSPGGGQFAQDIGIQPAMTLQCELIAINAVSKGESVGYGGAQVCPRDMKIGVAAIGYGDGYPRSMKQGAPVLVKGKKAPLYGPVSMDMITIDLSDQPDACVGDTVTLWGDGLPVEEMAPWADAIPWELICGVTARVRAIVEEG